MRSFADRNPVALAVYFLATAGVAMLCMEPVILSISLAGALLTFFVLGGRRGHGFALGLFLATALINPLVSHNGRTVLFVLNHSPITLEALLYGLAAGEKTAETVTDEFLWQCLETAQAAEFVRQKPGGLDEAVEQGGRNLSGGQKQRLTIARALVSEPEILILDDSASALDYATDAALRKALLALPATTTTFIVSQRTSSIRHADQILVMDDGLLVGCGTHDELLESCEVYREIHESQFRKGDQQA